MVLVEKGFFENTLDLGIKTEVQAAETGQVVNTPVGARHKIKCLSESGKTLHVYIPKIKELKEQGNFQPPVGGDELKNHLKVSEIANTNQLREILEQIAEKSVATHSPFFMNQLFSGVLPQMLMAETLIQKTKTTMATHEASPVFSQIEEEVISSLGELIGWPQPQRQGVAVPGGSAANFMALHCARQKAFPDFKIKGSTGTRLRVYVSQEAHYSMKKACVVLGLGLESLTLVASDAQGKMSVDDLESAILKDKAQGITPLMVCATAGTTVLGAFDPIDKIASVCECHNLWLHVDGAWGGPALFCSALRPLLKGIEKADSMTFDAHKLFGASLTCSFFLTKHEDLLFEANDVSGGDYIFHEGNLDRGRLSWQCGRRAEATSFWTIWKNVGTAGLGLFVDRLISVRDQSLQWIQTQPRLELVSQPEFLNVCIRVSPPDLSTDPEWSKKVRTALINNNKAMVNYSSDERGPFLRLILAHPYLEFRHIQDILSSALEVP